MRDDRIINRNVKCENCNNTEGYNGHAYGPCKRSYKPASEIAVGEKIIDRLYGEVTVRSIEWRETLYGPRLYISFEKQEIGTSGVFFHPYNVFQLGTTVVRIH